LIPSEAGVVEPFLMIDSSRLDVRELAHVVIILDEVIKNDGCKLIAKKLGITLPEPPRP